MRENRKLAKAKLDSINTVSELREQLANLRLTDEQREIAELAHLHGWSRIKIANHIGYSVSQVGRVLGKIYDRML